MHGFLEALRVQRWDDHRYYHHSRINQALHLVSAISFLLRLRAGLHRSGDRGADRLAGGDDQPAGRPFLLRAEGLRRRQPGHARAQGRDQGRLQSAAQGRAADDLGAVAAAAAASIRRCSASSSRTRTSASSSATSARSGSSLGLGGLLFRTVQLFFIKDVQTGLVWATKILTDPFHDIKLYYKAPLYLLRGELIDPTHAQHDDWSEQPGRGVGGGVAQAASARPGEPVRDHLAQDLPLDRLVGGGRRRTTTSRPAASPWRRRRSGRRPPRNRRRV